MTEFDYSKIYSYSKLKLFENCPQQYYFNYLDPEISPIKKEFIKPRDYNTKGQAVHGAITLFYHLPVSERNFTNLKKCLQDAWFSDIDPSKKFPLGETGGFKDLEHERKVYFKCLELLQGFFRFKDIDPCIYNLPTKNIKNSFSDYKDLIKPLDEKVFISGKFDRVDKLKDGNLKIVDFKTGKASGFDNFQLLFYKLLAELNFKNKVTMVSFYDLENKEIKDFDVSGTDQNKIKDEIIEKVRNIENTKEFLPKVNYLCNYCDFNEICPAKNKGLSKNK